MKSQKRLLYLTIGTILLLAIVISLLPKGDTPSSPAPESSQPVDTLRPEQPGTHGDASSADSEENAGSDKKDIPQNNSGKTNKKALRAARIERLRELLDDEDEQKEALKLAVEMSTGSEAERVAALDVFSWIGGTESVKALIPMLKSNGNSAERADMTLRDLIQRNMFEDSKIIDEDTWMEIIDAQESEDAIGEYLTLLTSFDVKEAVPVLLKLFDASDPSRKKLASEYMEFVAGGETIATKEQAEAWFQKYLKEHQEQE